MFYYEEIRVSFAHPWAFLTARNVHKIISEETLVFSAVGLISNRYFMSIKAYLNRTNRNNKGRQSRHSPFYILSLPGQFFSSAFCVYHIFLNDVFPTITGPIVFMYAINNHNGGINSPHYKTDSINCKTQTCVYSL